MCLHPLAAAVARETRYFATWKRRRQVEEHTLPAELQQLTGQRRCPFGDAGRACSAARMLSLQRQLSIQNHGLLEDLAGRTYSVCRCA